MNSLHKNWCECIAMPFVWLLLLLLLSCSLATFLHDSFLVYLFCLSFSSTFFSLSNLCFSLLSLCMSNASTATCHVWRNTKYTSENHYAIICVDNWKWFGNRWNYASSNIHGFNMRWNNEEQTTEWNGTIEHSIRHNRYCLLLAITFIASYLSWNSSWTVCFWFCLCYWPVACLKTRIYVNSICPHTINLIYFHRNSIGMCMHRLKSMNIIKLRIIQNNIWREGISACVAWETH